MNLAVSHEMVIEVWEVSTGRRQWANEIRGLALGNGVAFSPNGRMLATAVTGGITFWTAGKGFRIFDMRSVWLKEFAYLSDETMLLTSRDQGTYGSYMIEVVDVLTRTVHFQTSIGSNIHGFELFFSSKILVIGGHDRNDARFYDIETNTIVSGSDMKYNSAIPMKIGNCDRYWEMPWVLHGSGKQIIALDWCNRARCASAGNRFVRANRDGEFVVLDIDVGVLNDI